MAMSMGDAFGAEMMDLFDVVRRQEVVSSHGRSSVPSPVTTKNVSGVVNSASGNDLNRLEEADRMRRNISVVTSFALRGPAKDGSKVFKPDLVLWRGGTYVVKLLDPYPQFGPGFVQAICGSENVVDVAT